MNCPRWRREGQAMLYFLVILAGIGGLLCGVPWLAIGAVVFIVLDQFFGFWVYESRRR